MSKIQHLDYFPSNPALCPCDDCMERTEIQRIERGEFYSAIELFKDAIPSFEDITNVKNIDDNLKLRFGIESAIDSFRAYLWDIADWAESRSFDPSVADKIFNILHHPGDHPDDVTLLLEFDVDPLFIEVLIDVSVSSDDEESCEDPDPIPHHVYIIRQRNRSAIKIGVSNNPNKRLRSLQTASPQKLDLVHSIEFNSEWEAKDAEAVVHDIGHSMKYQLHGEWFKIAYVERAIELIKRIKAYRDIHPLLPYGAGGSPLAAAEDPTSILDNIPSLLS